MTFKKVVKYNNFLSNRVTIPLIGLAISLHRDRDSVKQFQIRNVKIGCFSRGMTSDPNNMIEEVDGVPVRSEPVGYGAAELLTCRKCGRSNAPNRFECIYCGTTLEGAGETVDLEGLRARELEAWENGINIVLLNSSLSEEAELQLSKLGLEGKSVKRIGEFQTPTPITRVATEAAAKIIGEQLETAGADIKMVSDEDLGVHSLPVRLRSIAISEASLQVITFNSNETVEFPAGKLMLVVTGSIVETRSEIQLKKKKGKYLGIDDSIVTADTGVADIYFDGDLRGFRILTSGFDFSVLGEDKSLLAADNLRTLVEKLCAVNEDAVLIGDYQRKRTVLDHVWPCTIRSESKGVQRSGFGLSVSKGAASSNEDQFTRYSRLLRLSL